jgi:hypothetical protein
MDKNFDKGIFQTIYHPTIMNTIIPLTPEAEASLKEDLMLLQRIAQKDSASFQALYRKYSGLKASPSPGSPPWPAIAPLTGSAPSSAAPA